MEAIYLSLYLFLSVLISLSLFLSFSFCISLSFSLTHKIVSYKVSVPRWHVYELINYEYCVVIKGADGVCASTNWREKGGGGVTETHLKGGGEKGTIMVW